MPEWVPPASRRYLLHTEQGLSIRALARVEGCHASAVLRQVRRIEALRDLVDKRVSAPGRAALKRLLDAAQDARDQMCEAASSFADQHREIEEREIGGEDGASARRVRYNAAESPLAVLGRRREKDGQPFLTPGLVDAGERLREDFELSQMGPHVTQNWDRLLSGVIDEGRHVGHDGRPGGPEAARRRVAAPLGEFGPGLGDVALRVCCFLEGLETAERRMGWSARSGKIVLRIALTRLRLHYDSAEGAGGR